MYLQFQKEDFGSNFSVICTKKRHTAWSVNDGAANE